MELKLKTSKKDEVIDITEKINKIIKEEELEDGICLVFIKHTTCAVTTCELTDDVKHDLSSFLRAIVPGIEFRHEGIHSSDHILSSIIGPSVSVPVKDDKLSLGTWQKVVLVELNGPRERTIELSFIES